MLGKPGRAWTAQQARNLMMYLGGAQPFKLLIHDRGSEFGGGFDEVFRSEGMRVIRTPARAPNANAHAEQLVRTVRADCLDHVLIFGRRHLERVLRVYVQHYKVTGRIEPSDSQRPTILARFQLPRLLLIFAVEICWAG